MFSDGERVIAIEFDKNGKSIYKSKLLLDEEDEIAILASNLELTRLNVKTNKLVLKNRFYTRKENLIKKVLLKEIEDSYKNKEYLKLKFLYQQYFGNSIKSYKKMRNELIDSINVLIDDKHRELFELLKLTIKKKQI